MPKQILWPFLERRWFALVAGAVLSQRRSPADRDLATAARQLERTADCCQSAQLVSLFHELVINYLRRF